ncbi:ADP-ribose diphosphatase [Psychrosphaera sp. 1_MG-2023]|uniref:ADP-ribose diphosphatase n=1 Tax=Psychrosphaera sp. 1_MG-2023 TaxID=3062643 RepID=UPI0026E32FDE|nr:ADP-ribose diphosphatase [Psychrosphaera sp. 1_MG-2023]MDO6718616.1 ADP-ribose diphosphatase [Psychrosphaera sp. 1_MG-2023]
MSMKPFTSQFNHSDVKNLKKETIYQGFFKLEQYSFQHSLFAGGESAVVYREILERGDAVAVLPYDPKTNQLVFIEQIRIGAINDNKSPWLLEVVAGMIDKDETKEQVALREAEEEAGLIVEELIPMLNYLSSPGGTTERIHLFLGIVDTTEVGGIYGLAEEQEDIKVHVMDFDDALDLFNQGVIDNASTVICVQWLALNKSKIDTRFK